MRVGTDYVGLTFFLSGIVTSSLTMTRIETEFSQRVIAHGVPRRVNRKPFNIRDVIDSFTLKNFIAEKKQVEYYNTMLTADTGWISYICCTNDTLTGRLIAANVVAAYDKENRRSVWQNLGNNEIVRSGHFPHLVVIDGYFDDSPSFRRDRIYDLMTYHHDRPETSIIVVGKTTSPSYMSKVLGIRPNFALLVTK